MEFRWEKDMQCCIIELSEFRQTNARLIPTVGESEIFVNQGAGFFKIFQFFTNTPSMVKDSRFRKIVSISYHSKSYLNFQ